MIRKCCYVAKGKDSCPLASVAYSMLESDGFFASNESMSICEKAICNQINRKISFDECSQILNTHANTIVPASLIQKVLHAIDHHQPETGDDMDINDGERRRCRMWKTEEDILLLAAIHKYGLGDWKSISRFVGGGRSRSQCSQRWGRALDPKITKMPWSPDEEKQLIDIVVELGEHSWANVAKRLGTRSDVQCRYRFYQITKKRPCVVKMMKNRKPQEIQRPESPPQALSPVFNPSVGSEKLENYNPFHQYPRKKSALFGIDLFDCPVEQLFPPLLPRKPKIPAQYLIF